MKTREEMRISGLPVSKGVAIGIPFYLPAQELKYEQRKVREEEVDREVARFAQAVERSKEDLRRIREQLENDRVLDAADIINAQIEMIQDPLMTTHIEEKIRTTQKNAESVFIDCVAHYQECFEQMTDPYLKERSSDVAEVSSRILGYLSGEESKKKFSYPSQTILFAGELSAADVASLDCGRVLGIVTSVGGETTHAAIIAGARGLPYVLSKTKFDEYSFFDVNQPVILDGTRGEIVIYPNKVTKQRYIEQIALSSQMSSPARQFNRFVSETIDGYPVKISANVDLLEQVDQMLPFGATGIGLFRSELGFLSDQEFPSEEKQYLQYASVVKRLKGRSIVIRTFDFGGDKVPFFQPAKGENHPFVGCHPSRTLLEEKNIFKSQMRAILRASSHGNVSVMFPMISSFGEFSGALALLDEVKEELKAENISCDEKIRVGCMIEVPSAVLISDLLAKSCDFLSIGTNDLVQYSLAVDRRHQLDPDVFSPVDPSILRMIKLVVSEANHQGISVSVCGEMAADPRFTALLIGLGVHELSVSCRHLPSIQQSVRRTSIVEASALVERALTLPTAGDIMDMLV